MRLLMIYGPPAVGKMTVGRGIAARSTYRLFHNHHTIEPLIEVFGFGTRAFEVLNKEFRTRVFEEAARDGLDLIFTVMWCVEEEADRDYVLDLISPYEDAGAEIAFVELSADLATRLTRNRGADRITAKPSKRDLAWSEHHVVDLDRIVCTTSPEHRVAAHEVLERFPHLRVDTTALTAEDAADAVLRWLADLPQTGGPGRSLTQ